MSVFILIFKELKGVKGSQGEIEDKCYEHITHTSFNFFYLLLTPFISIS